MKRSGFLAPVLVLLLAAGATLAVALTSNDDDQTQVATEDTGAPEDTESFGPTWLVPWGDGFLEVSLIYTEPSLSPEFRDAAQDILPQEVLDVFDDGEDITLSEAQLRLTEAGLLDEVEELLTAHPELLDVMQNDPAPPDLHAAISTDGSTWEDLDLDLPTSLGYISSVGSDGTHLVVATNPQDPSSPTNAVAVTDDLQNWTVHDLSAATRPEGLPEAAHFESSLQRVVLNDNGWLVTQTHVTFLDVETLLDLDPTVPEGWSWSFTPTGITVESYADGSVATEYTWEELGIDPALAETFTEGPPETTTVWAASWGEEPVAGQLPAVGWLGGAAAANDTFFIVVHRENHPAGLLLRSPDGLGWTEAAMPGGDGLETLSAVDGGILARVYGEDGMETLLSDDGGETWRSVTIPGLPLPSAGGGFVEPSAGSVGFATIVDAQEPGPELDVDPGPVTYRHEGFEITTHGSETSWSLTIVDVESGETVLDETQVFPTEEEVIAAEEAGDVESLWEQPAWVSYDNEFGVTYLHPETGDVIIEVPHEVEGQAHEAAWRAAMEEAGLDPDVGLEWTPDLWLIATRDGTTWLVEQLDLGAEPWPAAAAVNGDLVVVTIHGERTLYELS